jgi:RNase P subunit RPR2
MTHLSTPAARICPNCDGFATAAITTGNRNARGHLHTLTIDCRACNGLGTVSARHVREGARA